MSDPYGDAYARLLRAAQTFLDTLAPLQNANDRDKGKAKARNAYNAAVAELRDAAIQADDPFGHHLKKVTER